MNEVISSSSSSARF